MYPELHLSLRITAAIDGFSKEEQGVGVGGGGEEGRRINWRKKQKKKKTKLKLPRKSQQPAD